MEGFTPSFFLQLVVAVGSAGAVYGAIRADLNNMKRSLDEERRLREEHSKEDDKSFHNIRGDIGTVSNRVALLEGKLQK